MMCEGSGKYLRALTAQQLTETCPRFVEIFYEIRQEGSEALHIQIKIPHFRPKYCREDWSAISTDLKSLVTEAVGWAQNIMRINGPVAKIEEFAKSATAFCVFCNPRLQLFSYEMQQLIHFFTWSWFLDEYFDLPSHSGVTTYEDMTQATRVLMDILKGRHDRFSTQIQNLTSIPVLPQLANGLYDVRKNCLNIYPDFTERCSEFILGLEEYFHSLQWNILAPLDKRYSLRIFKQYRSADGAAKCSLDFFALMQGILIPGKIRRHLIFQTYFNLATDIIAFTNDVLGLKKDLTRGDRDNSLVFNIKEKCVPLEIAISEAVKDIEERLKDYFLIKLDLLKAFPDDEQLVDFIDMVESSIDGHYKLYVYSTRYSVVGSVVISEERIEP